MRSPPPKRKSCDPGNSLETNSSTCTIKGRNITENNGDAKGCENNVIKVDGHAEKRSLEADPEYEDVSSHQNKRLRLQEDDAKRQVVHKIDTIIREQFSQEMVNKEQEVLLLDERINETRENLFKLRACLVAAYYGKANQQSTILLNREMKADACIHPTVKRHIGKAPVRRRSVPNWTDEPSSNTVDNVPQSENLSLDKVDPAMKRAAQCSTTSQKDTTRGSRYLETKKIIIGNVSKFIPYDKREENDASSHKWMLYVRGPRDQPDISSFVEKVWFFLHPSYAPNDLVEVNRYPFHLTRRGWGEFPVRVQIHFKDKRNKKIDCIHKLKLDQTYTGLSTLGTETNITASLLIHPPDPSAAAFSSSSSKNKSKSKARDHVPATAANGLPENVVANIDGHVTIQHEEANPATTKIAATMSVTTKVKSKVKKEPVVKIEPMDTNEREPVSSFKDLVQPTNTQATHTTVIETPMSTNKLPSPVRKRLNPPGSVSLLNRPRGVVKANSLVVSTTSGQMVMPSPQTISVTKSKSVIAPTNNGRMPSPLGQNVGGAHTTGQLPQIIFSPARSAQSSLSPAKNLIVPLQLSASTSPKSTASTIRLPLIRATNVPLLRSVTPAMTSPTVRPTLGLESSGNRITLLKSTPTSKPVFQVNLATLGKLTHAQESASKPIVTSLLTAHPKPTNQPNTVAALLQAQRTPPEQKLVINALPKQETGEQRLTTPIMVQNTRPTTNPISIVNQGVNVRPVQPQPQLVRANVGGKLVWLQLIPSQIATPPPTPPTTSKLTPSSVLTPPQTPKQVTTVSTNPTQEMSVFHKVAVPKTLPPSKKNPSLGRPPKHEDKPPPKPINVADYADLTSLLRVLVREFPLVAKTADKYELPYCARSLREFTLWNIGKKRAAERLRASDLRRRLVSVVGGGPTVVGGRPPVGAAPSFRGEALPSVRQLVDWCREQAYTPVRVPRYGKRLAQTTESLSSLSESDVIVTDLLNSHAPNANDDESDVEIVAVEECRDATTRSIKKEVVVPSHPQKNFYMSADERGDFIGDLVSPLGINLQPYPVAPSVYATVVSGMLYKSVRNMVEDVLRTAHADVIKQGRSDELTVADVYKSLSSQRKLDCLTMAGLGCRMDGDPT